MDKFYIGKMQNIINTIKDPSILEIQNIDKFNDLVYTFSKFNLIITDLDCSGYFSIVDKEIAVTELHELYTQGELLNTFFHELAHFYQYEHGEGFTKKTFDEYLRLEQQAEIFSMEIVRTLEKKFTVQYLKYDHRMNYFNQKDIDFLHNWYNN